MRIYLVMLLSLFVTPALAGAPIPYVVTQVTETEETGYVGLVWTLGGGFNQTPQISAGFQSVDMESSGDVDDGYDINLRFALNGARLPETYSLRASQLFGEKDGIGNVGIGITNGGNWLATAGIQGDHVRLGVDLTAEGMTTHGELLSLELADTPAALNNCPAGYEEDPDEEACYQMMLEIDLSGGELLR